VGIHPIPPSSFPDKKDRKKKGDESPLAYLVFLLSGHYDKDLLFNYI
jgi:hypothetical protein